MLTRLSPEELFRHLVVFGSTGSGKTRHVILPLLAQELARDAQDPERRAGALVFDVKGDMGTHLAAVMKSAGREDEVIVLGRGGNAWLDPFDRIEADSRAVAERVIEIVRGIHSAPVAGAYDDFWHENNRRFLQVAAVLARALEFGDLGGVDGLGRAAARLSAVRCRDDEEESSTDDLECALAVAGKGGWISREDTEMALMYLRAEARGLSFTTWSVILNYAQTYLSCLRDSRIAGMLRPSNAHRFMPEDVIDHGRVVLVSLSRVHYGPTAEVYRTLIKTAFQQCALQRYGRSYFDGEAVRPINAIRPVYFVADEFPSLISVGHADDGDAFFLDKCREVKVGCILSAQGVSALSARMPFGSRAGHLLNNCCTKVFMATDCPETLFYFESTVSSAARDGGGLSSNPGTTPAAFRLPNYEFARPEKGTATSGFLQRPDCRAADLRRLETGEGIVVRPRGGVERVQFPMFSGS